LNYFACIFDSSRNHTRHSPTGTRLDNRDYQGGFFISHEAERQFPKMSLQDERSTARFYPLTMEQTWKGLPCEGVGLGGLKDYQLNTPSRKAWTADQTGSHRKV